MGQAVLLNLILRNYLHYNLIEQAHTLASKTAFPESASNNQFCRYLYAMGRIQAVQLEYSDAYLRLTMAARKAPQDTARGFALTVHKLSIIVQLLMGDIPERASFNIQNMRTALAPYLALTQAVRAGDMHEFSHVVKEHAEVFKADKNYSLIRRLGMRTHFPYVLVITISCDGNVSYFYRPQCVEDWIAQDLCVILAHLVAGHCGQVAAGLSPRRRIRVCESHQVGVEKRYAETVMQKVGVNICLNVGMVSSRPLWIMSPAGCRVTKSWMCTPPRSPRKLSIGRSEDLVGVTFMLT